jgi:hypothetical protein
MRKESTYLIARGLGGIACGLVEDTSGCSNTDSVIAVGGNEGDRTRPTSESKLLRVCHSSTWGRKIETH